MLWNSFFNIQMLRDIFLRICKKQILNLVQNVSSVDQKRSRGNLNLDQNKSSVGQNMSRLDQKQSRFNSISVNSLTATWWEIKAG